MLRFSSAVLLVICSSTAHSFIFDLWKDSIEEYRGKKICFPSADFSYEKYTKNPHKANSEIGWDNTSRVTEDLTLYFRPGSSLSSELENNLHIDSAIELKAQLFNFPFKLKEPTEHGEFRDELLKVLTKQESYRYYDEYQEPDGKISYRSPHVESHWYIFSKDKLTDTDPLSSWRGECYNMHSPKWNSMSCDYAIVYEDTSILRVTYSGEYFSKGEVILNEVIRELETKIFVKPDLDCE